MNIQELEARLKEIDELSETEPVEGNLVGDTEATSKLNISVKRKVKADLKGEESTSPPSREVSSVQTETLLDLNLGEVAVSDEYIDSKIRDVIFNQETVGWLPGATLRQIAASKNWELMEDYTYSTDGYSITAVKGFIYDRASIPRIFWVIIDKDSLSNVPPLFHDLLYRHGGVLPQNQVSPYRTFERREADDLFLELMRKSGVKRLRAHLAYQAVRKFGGGAWEG